MITKHISRFSYTVLSSAVCLFLHTKRVCGHKGEKTNPANLYKHKEEGKLWERGSLTAENQ